MATLAASSNPGAYCAIGPVWGAKSPILTVSLSPLHPTAKAASSIADNSKTKVLNSLMILGLLSLIMGLLCICTDFTPKSRYFA